MTTVRTFLLFEGQAQAALDLYASVLPDFVVEEVHRYGEEGPGTPGSIFWAHAALAGHGLMVIDSHISHAFTFTPAMSFHLTVPEAAFDAIHAGLSPGGETMMPVDDYGFAPRYTWFTDRFGVSWQLAQG